MTFEDRALRASRAVKKAVGGVIPPPIEGAGVVAPQPKLPFVATMLQAAAALVVVVLAVGYFSAGGFFAPFFGEALTPLATDTTITTEAGLLAASEKPEAPTTTESSPSTTEHKVKETTPPPVADTPTDYEVVILSPEDGTVTDDHVVLVKGEASPELYVVVNGHVALRDGEGNWQIEMKLEEGWNTIQAKGFVGDVRAAGDSIEVLFEPPPPSTTKPKPPPVDYAVHITSPADGAKVNADTILVEGEATPGLVVWVNGKAVDWVTDSRWKVSIPLTPGWNGIAAKAYVGETKVAYHGIEILNGEVQSLAITSPADGAEILTGESVLVTGEATEGLTVWVNGLAVEWIDATNWKVNVPLSAGWNGIAAKGYIGETKVAYDVIEVHLGEIVVVPFTVTQVYGTSDLNPPYESFYGTATPNGKVWIKSPYGEKIVYADADGNFEATIYFEGVPSGKTFEISVKDYEKAEYQYFSFTYTG